MTTYARANVATPAEQLRALFTLKPGIEPRSVLVWRVLTPNEVELVVTDHEAAARGFARWVTGLLDGSKVLLARPDGEIETYPPAATVSSLVAAHLPIDNGPPEAA